MAPKKKRSNKYIPFQFVLDELDRMNPVTRSMFGCTAVYIEEKIIFILREKEVELQDNGVWLATSKEHHEALYRDFPSLRSITVFGRGTSSWQVLPSDSPEFEESVLRACQCVFAQDPRIGKIPVKKKKLNKKGS